MTLIEKAEALALRAHAGQKRKWSDHPYITHLRAVADLVRTVDDRPVMIAAALLHDVLEDTSVTLDELTAEVGPDVAKLVVELTDVYVPGTAKNRQERKRLECERLAKVSDEAQTIKVADIIDNTNDILLRAPLNFAELYLQEKAALLAVLTRAAGDQRALAQ